jgi:hypothetical protein
MGLDPFNRPEETLTPMRYPAGERVAGALRAYGFYLAVALASSGATAAAVLLAR